MRHKLRWMHRRALAVVVGAVCVVLLTGTALAGHETSGVKSYTGCLVTASGTLTKITEGNTPAAACTTGQVLAHFSGGDITKITAGSGVTVTPTGGNNGEVTIAVDAAHSLPQGCSITEFAMKSGSSSWICADHSSGTGLQLSTSIVSGEGEVEYAIGPSYRVKNTPDCPSGRFATGFDNDGEIQCAAPGSLSSFDVVQVGYPEGEQPIASDGVYHDLVSVTINANSAGTYLLTAKGSLESSGDADDFHEAQCAIRKNSTSVDQISILSDTLQDVRNSPWALTAVTTALSGDVLKLSCLADTEADGVSIEEARIVGVKIGS